MKKTHFSKVQKMTVFEGNDGSAISKIVKKRVSLRDGRPQKHDFSQKRRKSRKMTKNAIFKTRRFNRSPFFRRPTSRRQKKSNDAKNTFLK